ncbi:ribonuclease H-like domain-containing protein [Tanacetum coccineum]
MRRHRSAESSRASLGQLRSDAVTRILMPSLAYLDAIAMASPGSVCPFLLRLWCRVVISSVSSPNEPKSRVFPPNAIQLTFTRSDLSYAVQQGTLDFRLQLYTSSTTSLIAYSDADLVGCMSTHRSTSRYCVFLGNNLLSWSFKRQHTLSHSSAEAEYCYVANVIAETTWLHNLLCELHTSLQTATLVYYDNVSAI